MKTPHAPRCRAIGAKRCFTRILTFAGMAGCALPALADTAAYCRISLDYAPALAATAAPTAVPGLTLFSVGILAATLGIFAWHKRPAAGKVLAVALWASAGLLTAQGGDGLMQAVRAAGPYEFTSTTGGTLADASMPYADPSPLVTVTNTSGVRVKITGNTNTAEAGSCTVGAEIAPGGSCTTQSICDPGTGGGGT